MDFLRIAKGFGQYVVRGTGEYTPYLCDNMDSVTCPPRAAPNRKDLALSWLDEELNN